MDCSGTVKKKIARSIIPPPSPGCLSISGLGPAAGPPAGGPGFRVRVRVDRDGPTVRVPGPATVTRMAAARETRIHQEKGPYVDM